MRDRWERGQATAELAALLPCLVAVLAVAWQIVLAGHAAGAAASAARAAARAEAVGADPRAAARDHLPPSLERGLQVRRGRERTVTVSLRVPAILHAVSLGRVQATARLPVG
jgi:pilus assembly protein CpaE